MAAEDDPRADIGVVLVHGIGDHREGETLVSFAEPMVDWLREWLRGPGGDKAVGDVRVVEARLRARRNEAESPAYAVAEVAVPSGSAERERWLMTEAWWGETVREPASLKLLGWMLSRGPLLIYAHFFLDRDPAEGTRRAGTASPGDVGRALLACGLAALVQCVALVALVLSLVPIRPWRRAVVAAVRALTLTLGDSYVLLENDFQRAAMSERVWRTVRWLAPRVRKVAVIAHSQGGAVAHEALQRGGLHKVALFLSFGSGLEKLDFLRLVRERRQGVAAATALAPLALVFGGLTIAAVAVGLADTGDARWLAVLAVFGCFAFMGAYVGVGQALDHYRDALRERLDGLDLRPALGARVRWLDFYASHDVVPMGRRSVARHGRRIVRRKEVINERSYLHDHVTYFTNRFGVLPQLWLRIGGLSRLPLPLIVGRFRARRFEAVHRCRSLAPRLGIASAWLALAGALALFHASLFGFGAALRAAIEGAGMKAVLDPVRSVLALPARLAAQLGWVGADATEAFVAASLGVAALALGVALWWLLFRGAWRIAEGARWRAACRTRRPPPLRLTMAFTAAWSLFALVPLFALVVLYVMPGVLSPAALREAVRLSLAWVAGAFALLFALLAPHVADAAKDERANAATYAIGAPLYALALLSIAHWLAVWLVDEPLPGSAVGGLLALAWWCAGGAWAWQGWRERRARGGAARLALLVFAPAAAAAAAWLYTQTASVQEAAQAYGATACLLAAVLAWWPLRELARGA